MTIVTSVITEPGLLSTAILFFDVSSFRLFLNETLLFEGGEPCEFNAQLVSESMANCDTVTIRVELQEGADSACIWTSDLTTAYVVFNSDYHT